MIAVPNSRRYGVLGYGDPNLDHVFAVTQAPRADEKVIGRFLGCFAGGTVSNAICTASRLGTSTAIVGRVGDDENGRFLTNEFQRFGVSIEHLQVLPNATSSLAMILIDASGEKALVYTPITDGLSQNEQQLQLLCSQSSLVYAAPYSLDEMLYLSRVARHNGALFAVDLESVMVADSAFLDALLASADLLFTNSRSFREVFKVDPEPEQLRRIINGHLRLVIVTCGAEGALGATRTEFARARAYSTSIVDTTGAGDCFNGAFLAAMFEGQDLEASLRFSCAAASFNVAAIGARSALPTREQVQARLITNRVT